MQRHRPIAKSNHIKIEIQISYMRYRTLKLLLSSSFFPFFWVLNNSSVYQNYCQLRSGFKRFYRTIKKIFKRGQKGHIFPSILLSFFQTSSDIRSSFLWFLLAGTGAPQTRMTVHVSHDPLLLKSGTVLASICAPLKLYPFVISVLTKQREY